LWHGANWSYMLWGGLHGLYLAINHAWHGVRRAVGLPYVREKSTWWGMAAGRTLTFLAVILAWTCFKAGEFHDPAKYKVRDLGVAAAMVKSMSGANGFERKAWIIEGQDAFWWCAGLLLFVNLLPNTQQHMARYRPAYRSPEALGRQGFDRPAPRWLAWRPNRFHACCLGLILIVTLLSLNKTSTFIYWQF
ncbi:MAG: hypothetical protein HZA50_14825, partial [Planctomycetes bacterium]|nr:hypothetical protein [Planctomycetota bacterium]